MRLTRLCCLLCIGLGVASAQDDSVKTGVFLNGRWWLKLNATEKICYLAGHLEGAAEVWGELSRARELLARLQGKSAPSRTEAAEKFNQAFAGHFTFEEMAMAIDRFYEDPTNRMIQVIGAFSVMKRKFEGARPAEIERLTAKQREQAALQE